MATAIGSLPHKSSNDAIELIFDKFINIPFWPQLSKKDKHEDMIFQFLEKMPGVVLNSERVYMDCESDEFFVDVEELFTDYEEIIADINSPALDKYGITFSSTITPYLEIVKKNQPKYSKGQVVGPFTLSTTLTDVENKAVFYDETLRDVVLKTLVLKALWQIREIRKASVDTTPIIFIDEPSISQIGTSAFITISSDEVVCMLKEISDSIKKFGGVSAIHCCGKCDWSIPIDAEVDIINLDAFLYSQNLSTFSQEIAQYLQKGGIIAWGVVPTLDVEALNQCGIESLIKKFHQAIDYLVEKGIDKKLLISQSMITPSCGAGSLTVELAEKAMRLTRELSDKLKGE